jgi:hypothetical protein
MHTQLSAWFTHLATPAASLGASLFALLVAALDRIVVFWHVGALPHCVAARGWVFVCQ